MPAHDDAVQQAQAALTEARQRAYQLQQTIDTLQAQVDAHRDGQDATEDIDATIGRLYDLEAELEDYQRDTLPALTAAHSKAQTQELLDQLSSEDSPLLTEDQARELAATQIGALRRELHNTKARLEDNTQRVKQLIDTLQKHPDSYSDKHISFPSPDTVTIHGYTYSAAGADDLRFMAQRAINRTWSN